MLSLQQTAIWLPKPHLFRFHPKDIQETCLLDDAVHPIPEDENAILDLPPRHLWLNQRRSLVTLQSWVSQSEERVQVDTYGLHETYVGNRVLKVTQSDVSNLVQAVAALWYEYSAGSHMFVYEAVFQPADAPARTLVTVALFPTPSWDHTFYRAVLIDVVQNGRPVDRYAAYAPSVAMVADIAETYDSDHLCWPQGLDDCFAQSKLHHYDHHGEMEVEASYYIIFRSNAFSQRLALLHDLFPRAEQYARDFLWRSRQYGLQQFTIQIYAITQHQDRIGPRSLTRTLEDFRFADELWSDSVDLWSTHGANDLSQLHPVWPQTVFQSGQSSIHLILNIGPIMPWYPILLSVVIRLGSDAPRRLETQAWQVPRQLTVSHLLDLGGLSGFVRAYSEPATLTYATRQVYGPDDMVHKDCGGHYDQHVGNITA